MVPLADIRLAAVSPNWSRQDAIWSSLACHLGGTREPPSSKLEGTCASKSRCRTTTLAEWGGWGSNPRLPDHESSSAPWCPLTPVRHCLCGAGA